MFFLLCSSSYGEEINVLVWNIQKSRSSDWINKTNSLLKNFEYALIQEATDREETLRPFHKAFHYLKLHESWSDDRYSTGLLSASQTPSFYSEKYTTSDLEPLVSTPKVIVVEKYSLEEVTLMMINIHAINFRGLKAFKRNLKLVAHELKRHEGPVIFAGDFNTWSPARKEYLDLFCQQFSLKEIKMKRYESFLQLDHVYAKGFKEITAKQFEDSLGSDHRPIAVKATI